MCDIIRHPTGSVPVVFKDMVLSSRGGLVVYTKSFLISTGPSHVIKRLNPPLSFLPSVYFLSILIRDSVITSGTRAFHGIGTEFVGKGHLAYQSLVDITTVYIFLFYVLKETL